MAAVVSTASTVYDVGVPPHSGAATVTSARVSPGRANGRPGVTGGVKASTETESDSPFVTYAKVPAGLTATALGANPTPIVPVTVMAVSMTDSVSALASVT